METVEIKKSNLDAAYRVAKEAGADSTVKMLEALFGEESFKPKNIMDRVKSLDDAIRELGEDHPLVQQYRYWMSHAPIYDGSETDLLAYIKLRIVCAALNEGWEPEFTEAETRYYPWFWLYTQDELDNMGDEEKYLRRMMTTGDYRTEYAGFGFASSSSAPSLANASFGSRLCLRTDELATYCGRQFIQLWADFTLNSK